MRPSQRAELYADDVAKCKVTVSAKIPLNAYSFSSVSGSQRRWPPLRTFTFTIIGPATDVPLKRGHFQPQGFRCPLRDDVRNLVHRSLSLPSSREEEMETWERDCSWTCASGPRLQLTELCPSGCDVKRATTDRFSHGPNLTFHKL